MKQIPTFVICTLAVSLAYGGGFIPAPIALEERDVETLEIGEQAPGFSLPDLTGTFRTLDDYKDAEILTIIFTCNHCPTAQAYEDRMIQYTEDYKDKGVQVVAIMPNSAMGLLLEECGYSDMNDSYAEMQIRARDKGYNFPYLYDGDDHRASLLYGPTTTPHAFVFDRDRKLRYVGRLDDKEHPDKGGVADDLRAATDALLKGQSPAITTTKAFGCSVKWSWKLDWANTVNQRWKEQPVSLDTMDIPAVKDLIRNSSEKLLLVNVWATWCAPCVIEYPEFVDTQRMYGGRDFQFVSISMDRMGQQDKALEFLQKSHSAVPNYLYSGDDRYAFIEALDPDWSGALPYTLLIEPGGNIIWKYQGPVDFLKLRRAIVDHPMIGRYF